MRTDFERMKENLRRSRRDEREWYLAEGVCPQCKKNKVAEGRTLCPDCLEYRRNYSRERYRADGEFRGKLLAANKELQKRWRAEGLCPRCGAPVEDGFSHCKKCREYFHKSNGKYRSKKRAEKEAAYAAGEPRPKRGRPKKDSAPAPASAAALAEAPDLPAVPTVSAAPAARSETVRLRRRRGR